MINHGDESNFKSCNKLEYAQISFPSHLMNTMLYTRPDIAYAVKSLSNQPRKEHWKAVIQSICLLRGTTKKCPIGNEKLELNVYTDNNCEGDKNLRKLILEFVITFAWRTVSRQLKLQKCVSLSPNEAQ